VQGTHGCIYESKLTGGPLVVTRWWTATDFTYGRMCFARLGNQTSCTDSLTMARARLPFGRGLAMIIHVTCLPIIRSVVASLELNWPLSFIPIDLQPAYDLSASSSYPKNKVTRQSKTCSCRVYRECDSKPEDVARLTT
jgi:hypothetical protein